jgi:hypothetical protein
VVLTASVRRRRAVGWFAVGLVAGGLLTATGLAVLGAPVQALLPPAARWALVGAAGLTLASRAVGVVRFPLPENRRLVPETVFLSGPRWSAVQFGVEMGSGVRTYVTSAVPYLLAVAVLCVASPLQAWAAGAGFAAGRVLMTVASAHRQDPATWREAWTRTVRPTVALLGASVAAGLALLALVVPG